MSDMVRILNRGYELIWREDRLEDALAGLPAEFEDLRVDWNIQEVSPGRALATIEMRGRGRSSGAPVEMRFAQLFTFRGRTAARMVLYDDLDEARGAAGL